MDNAVCDTGSTDSGAVKDSAEELQLLDYHPSGGDMRQEILEALSQPLKTLPPKYFYDQAGSLLFDQNTEMDEYYPTRVEISIM